MSPTSLNETDISEQLADLSVGLSSPYTAMENLHAQADHLSNYSTPEHFQTITEAWNEFCSWWQKPQNIIMIACLSLMPVVLLVVYALLKGNTWGWGCLTPLGFNKNKKDDSLHSAYTTRRSQRRAEGWQQVHPPQSRVRRMEPRQTDYPPRKGELLDNEDIPLTPLETPYDSTCNTFTRHYSRLFEHESDSIPQDNYRIPASQVQQSSSGHGTHTPPTPPHGQTSPPQDRDSTAQRPSSRSSDEAPPPPYENVGLEEK
ncbi:hypothetical protein FAVG1_00135 [Fusarium avenaceum]|nr:hypothetical protein FAVG1_00135 [Fusarium avenaceum]